LPVAGNLEKFLSGSLLSLKRHAFFCVFSIKVNEGSIMPEGRERESNIKDLPPHAQAIYRKALQNAHEEYQDSQKRRGSESLEAVEHKVAWAAVERMYEKGPDGKWQKKKRIS
jgi:cation transport regulator